MTPEKDMNPGLDGAAVAVEEEPSSRTTAADGPGEQDSPKEADAAGAEGDPGPEAADGDSVKKAEFQEISASPVDNEPANLNLLLDVMVPVTVELGRTSLPLKDILSTRQGSVIELDRVAGEPVDIMAGGKSLAKGEVVVVKDRFGIRVTKLTGSIEGVAKT